MAGLSNLHGVLVADKPRGPTSHDVVRQARRVYRMRAVGHAGTLDPMATGVLVLLLGEATKLSAYLAAQDKRYRATVAFGRATDTQDADGRVVEARELAPDWLDPSALQAALDLERVRTEQQPPAFSALKVAGRRAHRVSRQGNEVSLPARRVAISELSLLQACPTHATVELRVSKGYYVRAFAHDLGAQLGVPAHLSELRRLSSGSFTIEEATGWPPAGPVPPIDIAEAVCRELPWARLTAAGSRRARSGQKLSLEDFAQDPGPAHTEAREQRSAVAWLDEDGRLVALGERSDDDLFAVVRGFK